MSQCSNETLNHPVRPEVDTVTHKATGSAVVIAFVPESEEGAKPVYLRRLGLPRGAFRRISGHDVRCNDDDLASLFHRGTATYDETPLTELTIGDLDPDALAAYRRMRGQLDPDARELQLDDQDLARSIAAVKTDRAGNVAMTVAGLVTLGSRLALRRVAPMFRIDYIRMPSTEWIDDPEERGTTIEILEPLLTAIPRVVQNILADIPKSSRIQTDKIEREELPLLPTMAIREAVVNAVMHRSYRTRQPIQIIRFLDRIEIRNPGASLVPDERLGEPGSVNRNEKIAMILHETRLAENKGSGIRAMRAALERAGVVPPVFHSDRERDEFIAIFRLQAFLNADDLSWLGHFKSYGLAEEHQKALVLLRRNRSITNAEYRRLNHVDTLTAVAQLRELREMDLVVLVGSGATRSYIPGPAFERPARTQPKLTHRNVVIDRDIMLRALPAQLRSRIEQLSKPANSVIVDGLVLDLIRHESLAARQISALLRRTKQSVLQSTGRLVAAGLIEMTHPEELSHPFQAYVPTQRALDSSQPTLWDLARDRRVEGASSSDDAG